MARKDISRRDFVADAGKLALGAAIAPGFPMIVPRHVLGGLGYRAPSDIVNFAVVGFGGMGSGNAQELAKTEQLVAVCDVDLNFRADQRRQASSGRIARAWSIRRRSS